MKNNPLKILLLLIFSALINPVFAADGQAALQQGSAVNEQNNDIIKMSARQRAEQGIEIQQAGSRELTEVVNAPGEVKIDLYRSAQVTPRISAQIVSRHARLGDSVKKGQRLITLSSVAMAGAQGALVEADREWKRVKKLGRKVVSGKRYIAAQVARQRSYATVLAYGMSKQEVKELLAKGNASLATGEFDLLSPQNGRVIFDRFVIGEVVKPGRLLFEVSDESVVWVEAKLRPQQTSGIRVGTTARISMDGKNWVEGRVIQLHYRLDPGSRTLGVRIEVSAKNEALKNEVLHPGEYVQVALTTRASKADIAVPETAIVLLRGSPTVFKLNGDKLSPSPVITGASSGGWVEIISGVAKGNEIAVKGVFTLKSLLLKSQIGDAD